MAKKISRLDYLESVIYSVEERYDRPNDPRSIHEIAFRDFGETWEEIRSEYESLVKRKVSKTLGE